MDVNTLGQELKKVVVVVTANHNETRVSNYSNY